MANSLQLLLLFGLAFYSLSHTNKVIDRCWEKYGNVAAFALRFSHAHAGGTSSGASCASAQRPPTTASVCCANSLPLTGENGRWSSRRWAQTLLPLLSGRYGAAAAVAHSLRNDILRAVSHEQSLRPHVGDVRLATTCAAYSLRFLHAHAEDASSGASSASVRRPSSCASVCCASLRPAKAALANTKAPASSRSRRAADRCCDVLRLQSSSSSLSCSASTAMRDDIERRMRTFVFAVPALLSEPLPSASHTHPPPTM